MTTTNMLMDLPVVSTTIGPEWATKLVAALQVIDAHDHSTGFGATIPGRFGTIKTPGAYPYTVLTSDAQKLIIVDSTAARGLTLPAATNAMYVVIKDGAGSAATNTITITAAGSDTIDGAATYTIEANYAAVGLVSDGASKWHVV